jgi:hypothetical protein
LKIEGPVIKWKLVEPTIMWTSPFASAKTRAGISGVSFTPHLCSWSTELQTETGGPDGVTVKDVVVALWAVAQQITSKRRTTTFIVEGSDRAQSPGL